MPAVDVGSVGHPICVATNYSPWLGFHVEVPAGLLQQSIQNPDAVQAAMALGRLDFIAVLLSCIGVLIAVFGVIGFWALRPLVVKAARATALEEIKNELPKLLNEACLDILTKNPNLITASIRKDPSPILAIIADAKDALFGDIDAKEAQKIAEKIGKEADE